MPGLQGLKTLLAHRTRSMFLWKTGGRDFPPSWRERFLVASMRFVRCEATEQVRSSTYLLVLAWLGFLARQRMRRARLANATTPRRSPSTVPSKAGAFADRK